MKVLLICEDDYGVIGIAKDIDSAISFLIKENWLHEDTAIWYDYKDGIAWKPIKEVYGKDWEDFLRSLTIELFNNVCEDRFYLREEEVFGTP